MIKDRYTFDLQLEPLVQKLKCALIVQVLLAGKDIVVDDCHLTKDSRFKLCAMVKGVVPDAEIIYVLVQCFDGIALKRRLINLRGRSEFEWWEVMKKHRNMFEAPVADENEYVSGILEVNNE